MSAGTPPHDREFDDREFDERPFADCPRDDAFDADDEFLSADDYQPAPDADVSRSGRRRIGAVGVIAITLAAVCAVGGIVLILAVGIYLSADGPGRKAMISREALSSPPGRLPTVDEEQAWELGEEIVKRLNEGDRLALADLVDSEGLIGLAAFDLELSESHRRVLLQEAYETRDRVLVPLLQVLENGGDVRFLSVAKREGTHAALFRVLSAEGGLSYMAFFPTKDGRIADAYIFDTGQRVSAGLRSRIGVGTPGDPEVQAALLQLPEMVEAIEKGDPEQALAIYAGMPKVVQDLQTVQCYRVTAASLSDDEDRYRQVLADFDARFPKDPSLDLMKIDYYVDEPEKMIAVLERLDRAVDGDPHLRGLLAEYLPLVDRNDDALEQGWLAVEEEPDLWQARVGLLSGLAATGDFEGAVGVLLGLRWDFDYVLSEEELKGYLPRGDELIASDAYHAVRWDDVELGAAGPASPEETSP
ncbi:hypothetical protein [Alienimonas chondri]|uniref:Uncharacterized protein n=1 Tax=Alienimonas chondri TaxID=2681879 RepID=A0ABX1VL76_9PLAN|nr:hypothetical protein [Alienimonas chondri]NNJ27848.1 hypothetical protein [Alienimonas chondri]